VRRLHDGSLPARAACITFDDGYADNHVVALPILQRHGLCATFFIATGFLGGGRMFNDSIIETIRRATGATLDLRGLGVEGLGVLALGDQGARRHAIEALLRALKYRPQAERDELTRAVQASANVAELPDSLMMTPEQVRGLHSAGMQIGAHTVSHPILARLDESQAQSEIAASRDALQDLLGERIGLFAYPNGKPDEDYTSTHVRLVREAGFDAAVSTAWGTAVAHSDSYQLPRFTPWDRGRGPFGLRLMRNLAAGHAKVAR
jgi:peptidoglycan/xylan/chitin deacetylase (PgdA/CDA1 family)